MKLTPARRRWLYRVSIAAIPLGIALGWLDKSTAALAVPLLVALLNVPKPRVLDGMVLDGKRRRR